MSTSRGLSAQELIHRFNAAYEGVNFKMRDLMPDMFGIEEHGAEYTIL